jgi:hypothetical protein
MKKVVKAGNLCLLMLGIILTLSFVTPPIHASASDIEFYVDPAVNSYPSSTPLHAKFNITVMWNDTGDPLTGAFAWQVTLSYNSTLLNCTRGWQPVADTDYIFYGMTTVKPSPSFDVSSMLIMDSLYSGTGSGSLKKLAILEFDIMYVPLEGVVVNSALNINNADSFWSPDGIDWPSPTLTDGIYYIPELSIAITFLALFATGATAIVLRKKR